MGPLKELRRPPSLVRELGGTRLTVSDQLNEVLHRLLQADSVENHRFEVPVLEGANQADSDHRLPGHVPLDAPLSLRLTTADWRTVQTRQTLAPRLRCG